MHVEVDLGFSSLLVLVLCAVVVPVISLVTRLKWRAAATRKEEIKRLLVVAAEEASRAEFEATVSYGAVSVSRNNYQCAVCFCPTTTRCARCKAVRYCSGKCQIIHWRRGHKEECHPSTTTYDDRSNYQKVASQDQHDMYDGRYNDRSVETSFQKPVLSDSILSPEASVGESIKAHPVLDTEGTDFIHESPGTSFSGFSTPTGSSFSEFSTPEFSDSDSLDSFATLSKPNQSKPHSNDGKSQCSSSSLCHSISSKNDDSILKPAKVSLDFWGRTLDSGVNSSDAKDNSSLPNSCGPGNSKSVNDESFLHFKFNLSGSVPPSLHAKSLKMNDSISDDALPYASQGKPIDKVALSEKNSIDAPQFKSSSCMSYERSNHMDNDANSDSNASSERKSVSSSSYCAHLSSSTGGFKLDTDASNVCRSPTSRSEKSNVVVNDPIGTPHLSKSRLSSTAPQTHLTSSISRQSVSNVRLGKVENVEPGAAFSSQMASCSPSSINGLKSSVWKVVDQFRGPKSDRYSDKGLSLYDLFVKLYTSNKVDMQPCGLINCGNSCYANVVLQCLAFTPPLTAYFAQGLHSKACVNKDWCFSCEFESLILKAKKGKSPLSPIGILSQLQSIGSPLTNGREEDAHEFLRYAIDAMDSHEETSLMGLTFSGYLRSKIKCMKCHYKSERQERMMDLTVEIEGDIGKLEDALKRFTGTEILDGNNKYQCSRCKSYEKAKKKLTILEAPNILTIALKRFQSGKFGKLNKSIRFPEILDLAPYMSGTSDKSPIYRLYGVVVHLDVMNAAFSGHYVCYVKNIQNKWFKIDDSTVTAVELERALTKGAYMLLYARCSPRAPRLIRNRIVSADPKNKCSPSKINPKNTALESRTTSVQQSVVQLLPDSNPPDSLASVESFYLKFHRLQRILEEDSSSDFSFTSSNSDEGSCSTDSTRDSASTDDLSDNIFGGWNNSWGNPSDSDTSSSSSSPLYSRHSRHAHMNQSGSSFHERSRSQIHADSIVGGDDPWDRIPSESSRLVDLQGKGGNYLFHSDKSRQCRKLASSSSSSCRENDSTKLGSSDVKSGVSFRRSVSERTA